MDNETREFLELIAVRLETNFNDNLQREIAGVKVFVKEQIEDTRVFVKEQVEASETRVITAFWKWAQPMEARMRRPDVSDATANA